MSLKASFILMADYNQWMNRNIYEAASTLSTSELKENRGAFFGSIIGTLNHILVGDTIWLKRFADHPAQFKTLDYVRDIQNPKGLNTILYTTFDELLIARKRMDNTILEFADELSDDVLISPLTYQSTKGELFIKNLGFLIQHLFNHQTHHRGQVTTLLNQAGIDVGTTDLLLSIPNQ